MEYSAKFEGRLADVLRQLSEVFKDPDNLQVILHVRTTPSEDVRRLSELAPSVPADLLAGLIADVRYLPAECHKIETIKRVKAETGLSLIDAKNFVESLRT